MEKTPYSQTRRTAQAKPRHESTSAPETTLSRTSVRRSQQLCLTASSE